MLNFKVHFFFLGFVSTLLHPMFVTSMQSSSINSIGWGWHMPMELDLHVDALMSCSLACTITDIISGFEWQDFRLSNDETLMVLGAWTFLGAGGEHSTARFSFFIPSINFVFEHDVVVASDKFRTQNIRGFWNVSSAALVDTVELKSSVVETEISVVS